DLDLLVIAQTSDPVLRRAGKIRRANDFAVPVDFFVYTPDELNEGLSENRFFLTEEMLRKGRVVYEKPGAPPLKLPKKGRKTMTREADVRDWLARAEEELEVASIIIDSGHLTAGGFHCQQAVEMALKAYLLAKAASFPRTHELKDLCDLAEQHDASLREFAGAAESLNDYYWNRYV